MFFSWFAAALDDQILEPGSVEFGSDLRVVVAAVEVHRVHVIEESGGVDRFDGRAQEFDVVAVRSVDRPAEWYAVTIDADRPLPAEFRPIARVLAGAFAAVGGLVQAAVDGDLAQVETDDPVERGNRFSVMIAAELAALRTSTTGR